jgi:hypothetical protein
MIGLFAGASAFGELLAYEGFDYSAGTALNTTAATGGWSTGWKADLGLTTALAADYVVTNGSLTSGAFTSGGLAASGNGLSKSDLTMYRGLNSGIDWDSSSTTYISALVHWEANHACACSRMKFFVGHADTEFGLSGTGTINEMRLRVRNSYAATVYGTDIYEAGQVYMMVAKIETTATGNDAISLAVFGPTDVLPVSEPVWEVTASVDRTGTKAAVLWFEGVEYNSSSTVSMDELQMVDNWRDVSSLSARTVIRFR